MFRKILSILIAIVYLNLSIGVSLHAHFCNDNIESLSLFIPSEDPCEHMHTCHINTSDCCSMDAEVEEHNHNNCCSDEEINVKLDTEQLFTSEKLKIKVPELNIIHLDNDNLIAESKIEDSKNELQFLEFKEAIPKIPFRILNNQFTFYA